MKVSPALTILVLAILIATVIGDVGPVAAQDSVPVPDNLQAELGENRGEIVLTWDIVEEAEFYRFGWLSVSDYLEYTAAGRDWQDSMTYRSVANDGQSSLSIQGFKEGDTYIFIVGSSQGRQGEPSWSPRAAAIKLEGCGGDRDALTALYNSTDGANWRNDPNWLDDTAPLDEWFGVSTDNHGCVLFLYLPNNDLAGEIPPELANLPRLRLLHLSGNELTGEIPSELAGLGDLRVLNLWNNELNGEIPTELGGMTNLSTLDLGRNELEGEIPTGLTQLTNLRVLSFNNNMLSGEIPSELGTMAN
ncbi:MAG: hypothetical protein OXH30_12825, partial [Chloroflexi bacterium]|nr:hypothetical protein [Chloroflexota bacterium]